MKRLYVSLIVMCFLSSSVYGLSSEDFGLTIRDTAHITTSAAMTLYMEHVLEIDPFTTWMTVTGFVVIKELIDAGQGYNGGKFNFRDLGMWQLGYLAPHFKIQF